jgi:Uncharacterized conserved protein
MSITVLDDVILPTGITAVGVTGSNVRKNERSITLSGERHVNQLWSRTERHYTLGTVPLTLDQWQDIETIHEITEGGAYGFLMEDPKDCRMTTTHGKATLVSAPAHTYQLIQRKFLTGTSRTKDRNITRPKAADFILYLSGVPTLSYTLNVNTGVVTIPADPTATNVTWSGSFYTPVQFENDEIDWTLVKGGSPLSRLMAGPNVMLIEVRE